MFITIKYGEDENLILNPDCTSINFLLHLKDLLEAKGIFDPESGSDIDICDWQGVVKGLRKLHAMENVGRYVTLKETYIALLVNTLPNDEDEVTDYIPLLVASNEKAFQTLHGKLTKQIKFSRLPPRKETSLITKVQQGKQSAKPKHETTAKTYPKKNFTKA